MTESTGDTNANKRAWDELYRDTPGSVWGSQPIPFVAEFLADIESDLSSESRLLDAAAGEGRHVPVLLRSPGIVFACDASSHALEKIAQFNGSVQRHQCDLAETPFADDFFDFISLIDTIETLPNPDVSLDEMHRILKPGGLLLCNIPGKEDNIAEVAMQPVGANEAAASYLYQGTYFYRFYEETEALSLVKSCGFEVQRNEIRHWEEEAHPGFREYAHEHTSRVLLLRKPMTVST
ncbi:MAG: class I SAM-dependent methyltransferase [Verrucomicrobiae bacterium]|nr:class I SAM-dependent methyltransferase [Verrucomicrobiae bacterium]